MSDLNDPRVLFAAERTLLAWNRTSISLMAFGFVVERFGLFLDMTGHVKVDAYQRYASFYVGISFVLLATFAAVYSIYQHKRILMTLRPIEIPTGYNLVIGVATNGIVSILGFALSIYLALGFI